MLATAVAVAAAEGGAPIRAITGLHAGSLELLHSSRQGRRGRQFSIALWPSLPCLNTLYSSPDLLITRYRKSALVGPLDRPTPLPTALLLLEAAQQQPCRF